MFEGSSSKDEGWYAGGGLEGVKPLVVWAACVRLPCRARGAALCQQQASAVLWVVVGLLAPRTGGAARIRVVHDYEGEEGGGFQGQGGLCKPPPRGGDFSKRRAPAPRPPRPACAQPPLGANTAGVLDQAELRAAAAAGGAHAPRTLHAQHHSKAKHCVGMPTWQCPNAKTGSPPCPCAHRPGAPPPPAAWRHARTGDTITLQGGGLRAWLRAGGWVSRRQPPPRQKPHTRRGAVMRRGKGGELGRG